MTGARRAADRLGFGVVLYVRRDQYVKPDSLAKLVSEGTVSFVKYAVERGDPAADPYLDAIVAAIGTQYVASGMGETPIADHIGRRRLSTFTSGAVCLAPATATRILMLLRKQKIEAARELAEPLLAFERLRAELGGIQVLHDAISIAGIAEMGPLLPMVSNTKAQHRSRMETAAQELLNADSGSPKSAKRHAVEAE
jgi:dihydrodipicolinate synthase/N-acetylneuraminate lyase